MSPSAETSVRANISLALRQQAARHPERVAVVGSDRQEVRFGELEERCDALAHGLVSAGLGQGDRACLFVRPGPELIAITHAFFRVGIVPVLIDPGMGRRSLLACVEKMAPRGLVGIPRAHVARRLFPRAFRSVEVSVTVGPRLAWGGHSLKALERTGRASGTFTVADDDPARQAAILFTSGSTGPPKGVSYSHGNFAGQLVSLQKLYQLEPGEVDCACFPLFALFDNALGMTSVFPDMDPSRPGSCDPAKVFAAVEENQATFTFGSPAIWERVLAWGAPRGKRFSRLRRLTIAGAPVAPRLVAGLRAMLPDGGDVHTPYGATESLPVSSISGAEIEALRPRIEGGEGTCVGHPVPDLDVRLAPITDEALGALDPRAPEVGEVCVRGPVVTESYVEEAEATQLSKVRTAEGLWHRMGDVGRFDGEGRLWYLGRKSHRLRTPHGLRMPVPTENEFNTVAGVRRTALIGVGEPGAERPFLVVEPKPDADKASLERDLQAKNAQRAPGESVERFLHKDTLPTDVRHNAKIRREDLKRWAQKEHA